MANPVDVVKYSIEYYDKNREKFNKFYKHVKYISFEKKVADMEHNEITFYDKNKNIILKSRYEILGQFNNHSNTWVWAWSNPTFTKNTLYLSRKILNYGLDVEVAENNMFMKTELITSRFRIANPIQLDIHVSIASYLTKVPAIYSWYDTIPSKDLEYRKYGMMKPKTLADSKQFIEYFLFILDHEKLEEFIANQ